MEPLVVSAPGRANLIGNPTDIYGGAVLSCSVPLRARVRVEPAEGLWLETGQQRGEVACDGDLVPRGDLLDVCAEVGKNLYRFAHQRSDLVVDLHVAQVGDRKSTRLNSSHMSESRMPPSA